MSQKPPAGRHTSEREAQAEQTKLSLSSPLMMMASDGKTMLIADRNNSKWEEIPLPTK